jgi:hypothetical protein
MFLFIENIGKQSQKIQGFSLRFSGDGTTSLNDSIVNKQAVLSTVMRSLLNHLQSDITNPVASVDTSPQVGTNRKLHLHKNGLIY